MKATFSGRVRLTSLVEKSVRILCRWLRIAIYKLLRPSCRLPWSTTIESGCVIRATDGGQIELGRDCHLSRGATLIAKGAKISIGSATHIGPWTIITARSGITIGDHGLIAERVTIRDQDHAIHRNRALSIAECGYEVAPIVVGSGVWICAGGVLLKGVSVGDGAVVGANAVVASDIPECAIFGGIPARQIGTRRLSRGR